MKKIYNSPALALNEVQLQSQLLDNSLMISNTPVDGSKALAPEDESWNIWNDEE